MAKTTKRKSTPAPVPDPIAAIFEAWRLWLLGALIGALLAWLAFQIAPPDFRARATVVVDQNLEQAWQYFPDRQLSQFLLRETERLEQIAWSDEVMNEVAAEVPGFSVEQLRGGSVLLLAHPSDGGWHFYADDADASTAQQLAAAWAQAFVDSSRAAITASPDLQATRAALSAELLAGTDVEDEGVRALMQDLIFLAEHTKGLSMYTEISVSQIADLPTAPSLSLSTYLLVGSIAGALAAPLYVLLRPARKR
jgi:hypothetical protein